MTIFLNTWKCQEACFGLLSRAHRRSRSRMERSEIRGSLRMVRYRRNNVPGGTFFFTVTLRDRRSSYLINHISNLRNAFRVAWQERPFAIDAIVILPDNLHAVWTLPEEDSDFSGRWRRIKSHFARHVAAAEPSIKRKASREYDLWQSQFWEHTIRDDIDFVRHVHLHPLQPGQARARFAGRGLGLFLVPRLRS